MTPMRSGKVEYIEGLRGLAAMQVVALHFVTAFAPIAADHAWAPLRVLWDGHTAVYVFFVISGAVLTPSLARPDPFLGKLAKRIVRLAVPVAAAAAFAFLLIALLPDAHRAASAISGSAWLAMDSSGAPTFAHLAREIGLDSLLLGYSDSTLLAPLAPALPPMQDSLDAPFWSLHLELYGSLLILVLVTLRARSTWLHRAAAAAAALAFGTHPMFLFVLGHLAAPLLGRRPAFRFGAMLLVLGLAMSATKDWGLLETIRVGFARTELASAPNLYQFQSQLAAVALTLGVLTCPLVWPVLESAPFRRLGRLSFSVYLVHFPILFTLVCAAFASLSGVLPYAALVLAALALFLALTLIAASAFERWIDRPAIALSRRLPRASRPAQRRSHRKEA